MKPNDEAYQAARAAILKMISYQNSLIAGRVDNESNTNEIDRSDAIKYAKVALDAAYAAQFKSEDYAGLVERLRHGPIVSKDKQIEAADALEALLAEREAWKGRQEATAATLKQKEREMSDDETAPEMLERLGTDAMLWAQEFSKTAVKLGYSEMDEGWLIGWFANAIENCDVIRCNQLRADLAAALDAAATEKTLREHETKRANDNYASLTKHWLNESKLRELLTEIVEYNGGAGHALADEYVVARIKEEIRGE